MMAFGDVAVDERRPVARFPALSMVCGVLANALGMCRTRPAEIQSLQSEMEIASRLDRPGHRMRDYATAQLAKSDTMWTSRGQIAGRDGGNETYDNPSIIERDFWADASVTVAVALPDTRIDGVAAALNEPARPLFLGRAACPPSRPILLGVVEATDVLDALENAPLDSRREAPLEAQWPERLSRARTLRIMDLSDIKDWRNRVHSGTRRVREGIIQVRAAA